MSDSPPPAHTPSTAAVVQIRDLHFSHGERVIFDGIDLDIAPGGVTARRKPSPSTVAVSATASFT